jgi:hypothetical protein
MIFLSSFRLPQPLPRPAFSVFNFTIEPVIGSTTGMLSRKTASRNLSGEC